MRKMYAALMAVGFVGLVAGFSPKAEAGSSPDIYCDTCTMFKQLQTQTPRYVAPAPKVHKTSVATSVGQTCGWVLNTQPTAVVLRKGVGNSGGAILGWNASGWSASQHYAGFVVKRVCFPRAKIVGVSAATLCGDIGWQQAMLGGRFDTSSPGDPFCIAGSACPSHLR